MSETIDTFACFGSTCSVVRRRRRRRRRRPGVGRDARAGCSWSGTTRSAASSRPASSRASTPTRGARCPRASSGPLREAVAGAAEQHRRARRRRRSLREIEAAGYRADLGRPLPLTLALRLAPRARARRRPSRAASWRRVAVRPHDGRRPPPAGRRPRQRRAGQGPVRRRARGARSTCTRRSPSTARATCASAARPASRGRSPCRARSTAASCTRSASRRGGVATSGIGRRSWLDGRGAPGPPSARPRDGPRPRSPASCRRPRSPRPRSRPRSAPRRPCSAAPTAHAGGSPTAA